MPSHLRYGFPLAAFVLSLAARSTPAEPLHIVHAQRTSSAASLRDVVTHLEQASQTTWIAWTVPTRGGVTLGSGDDSVAYLEHGNERNNSYNHGARHTDDHAVLLLRVAARSLTELRIESPTRTLDAADLPVVELTGITAEQSLEDLRSLTVATENSHVRDSLVLAISLHGSPATVPTLASLTTATNPVDLREKACFWLGNSTDAAAFATLQHLARTDPDPKFREKLPFDLTLSKQAPATEELIRMAHEDPAPEVRKQAQFWMAHLGGNRIVADLRDSAASDQDTDVRKSAVFALSQLPADQATPQLIHVAQTNNNPEIRKQAVFWLGQSSDPNALAFLTKLLEQ